MSTETTLRRTALYANHKQLGARLVDFHGWELPVQYDSIIKEHTAVRSLCGVFDVSHMGQVWVRGPQALAFLQKINTNDISLIGPGKAIYSHLPNENGGIIDDVIISCFAKDRYFIVVNAATIEKDFAWFSKQAKHFDVELENKSDYYGMIAIQGPKAAHTVAVDLPAAADLPRFGAMEVDIFDQPSVVTRTGYTGEDGFEFIVPNEIISRVWDNLITKGRSMGLVPCGLGARDTLRLEAGYLLYGQDIDDEHSSFEAGYDWVVKLDKGDFVGKKEFLRQKKEGLNRRLIGLKLVDRGVPRPGCPVTWDGKAVGSLCSATFSPTLQSGIGVGYLSEPGLKPGDKLSVELHGRPAAAEVVRMPFYKRSLK